MIPLLILAGGRATRLGEHSAERPKFLAPLLNGKVFADVQLAWVKAQGFHHVTLSIGYRAQMIRETIGDGARFGLDIRYVEDGPTPLGTGGAVRAASMPSGPFAVLFGDTVLDLDCAAAVKAAEGAVALMTVSLCPSGQPANAELTHGRVTYDKRSPDPRWHHIDYGLSVLSPAFVAEIPSGGPSDLSDTLSRVSKRGELVGFLAERPFREINTPEALESFREWAK